jgi:hypothetical protein
VPGLEVHGVTSVGFHIGSIGTESGMVLVLVLLLVLARVCTLERFEIENSPRYFFLARISSTC